MGWIYKKYPILKVFTYIWLVPKYLNQNYRYTQSEIYGVKYRNLLE